MVQANVHVGRTLDESCTGLALELAKVLKTFCRPDPNLQEKLLKASEALSTIRLTGDTGHGLEDVHTVQAVIMSFDLPLVDNCPQGVMVHAIIRKVKKYWSQSIQHGME